MEDDVLPDDMQLATGSVAPFGNTEVIVSDEENDSE